MTLHPIAKINLGLNIISERPDGYHDLETVFYPIPHFQDDLTAELDNNAAPGNVTLTLDGAPINCAPEKNLIAKAYHILNDQNLNSSPLPAIKVSLTKRIPMQAGMGGGSSDGAFAMKAINILTGLNLTDEQLEKLALKLGADAPFFIRCHPCFATGVGEKMTPIELDLSRYDFRFIKHPDIAVSTADAFRGIPVRKPEMSCLHIINNIAIEDWKHCLVNDFEATVFAKYPALAEIKQKMYDDGAIYAAMTGSGSAIFGIFNR